MKTVEQLTDHYDLNWLAGACKELHVLNQTGLWPKHCPFVGDLQHRLAMEGYPQNQVQNIATDFVKMSAVAMFPVMLKELDAN
ncbi:hypothetical protein D3C87_324850 [compost metagenome]